ncbi:hypothetical protein DERF_007585 [Dermatophagoides farinae]|uniref:Uncharacterized protein n=1 Tax=Dermatophagoides farinae TaxID=6954 RepID=A0A922L3B4_DERFA|nr:hypothetical protein DERF_007585 [Dermatophagoides farinae]
MGPELGSGVGVEGGGGGGDGDDDSGVGSDLGVSVDLGAVAPPPLAPTRIRISCHLKQIWKKTLSVSTSATTSSSLT